MTHHGDRVGFGSSVTLREITAATVRDITSLEVSEEQRKFVAPNGVSIAEAHFTDGAWFRAIHADETPVGFVMLFDQTMPGASITKGLAPDEIGLWRLMVDHRYQRMGFGRRALGLVRAFVRTRPRIKRLVSSYVPGGKGPEEFYRRYGFANTGRLRNQDTEIEIWIEP